MTKHDDGGAVRAIKCFEQFSWGCGHTGPAACAKCFDARCKEVKDLRERLEAMLAEKRRREENPNG